MSPPASPSPESPLLAAALSGDRQASNELVVRVLLPAIEAVVSRFLIGSRRWQHSVDDLAHEVLIHLFKDDRARLRKYDRTRGALTTYVQTVTRNWLIDFFEKRPPPEPAELPDEGPPPDSGPERQLDLGRQIEHLAESLGDDDYLLFRWAYLEDVPRVEIASRLQISLEATHRRIQRLEARAMKLLSTRG